MNIFNNSDRFQMWELNNFWHLCLWSLMTGLHVWPTKTLQTEGQCVNVTQSLCHAVWLTHAGDDTVDWQASESMVDSLVHSPGISSATAPRWLPLPPDKCWVLLFGDIDVKTCVRAPHDVAGSRVQQDVGGVQSAHSDQTYSIPAATETWSALNCVVWCVFSFLGFFTLWLTFCEHERRQRWNSFPGIPRRIYFPPGGCDALHWLSSAGRFGAIGQPNMHRPP